MNDNLEFYNAFAEVYDHWYWDRTPEHTLDLWEAALGRAERWTGKDRLLDLGCGSGVHLRGWSSRGWEVEGLDGAPAMLRRARRSGAAPQEMTLYCADVRVEQCVASLAGRYQMVAAHFNFLNQFGPKELPRLFRNVSGLLAPGSVFATDVTNYPDREQPVGTEAGDWRCEKVLRTGGSAMRRIWVAGDRRWVETIYAHEPRTIFESAAAAGFLAILDAPFDGNFGPSVPDPAADRRLLAFKRG